MDAVEYTLNPGAAREGDNMFTRITDTGAYTGIFTKAKHIVADTGSSGIELSFKADSGAEVGYLTLYTHNKQGQPIFGLNQLSACLTCFKLRGIKPVQILVDEYDYDLNQMRRTQVMGYPALMDRPIGVVLQVQEYVKRAGEVASSLALVRFFDPSTRQTASEILDKAEPKKLAAFLAGLKDKKLPVAKPGTGSIQPPAAAPTHDDFDDDIPF